MGHTGRVAQSLDEGQGGVALRCGEGSRGAGAGLARGILGLGREEPLQAEPGLAGLAGLGSDLGHLTSEVGRAGGAEPVPPLRGSCQILGFHHQCLARLITGLSPGLAIKGGEHLGELCAPQLPLTGCCWPGTLRAHVSSHPVIQPHNLQPHTVHQPLGEGRGADSPKGAPERQAGALFTQLMGEGPPGLEGHLPSHPGRTLALASSAHSEPACPGLTATLTLPIGTRRSATRRMCARATPDPGHRGVGCP